MIDQANILRDLVEQQHWQKQSVSRPSIPNNKTTRANTIAITSGKGGVGKSCIALNVAIALSLTNSKVCLLDANLGLGNIDLLCGLNGYWNLSHVITGTRQLDEIMLDGPAGIHVVPGASRLAEMSDTSMAARDDLFAQLQQLEEMHDYIIIDTGTGIHSLAKQFIAAADRLLVVTTPEPTSIADAYAVIKTFSNYSIPQIEVIVNQAETTQQGETIIERLQTTTQLFLRSHITSAGIIPFDSIVPRSVSQQTPFLIANPTANVSRAISEIADRIVRNQQQVIHEGYFRRIQQHNDVV